MKRLKKILPATLAIAAGGALYTLPDGRYNCSRAFRKEDGARMNKAQKWLFPVAAALMFLLSSCGPRYTIYTYKNSTTSTARATGFTGKYRELGLGDDGVSANLLISVSSDEKSDMRLLGCDYNRDGNTVTLSGFANEDTEYKYEGAKAFTVDDSARTFTVASGE